MTLRELRAGDAVDGGEPRQSHRGPEWSWRRDSLDLRCELPKHRGKWKVGLVFEKRTLEPGNYVVRINTPHVPVARLLPVHESPIHADQENPRREVNPFVLPARRPREIRVPAFLFLRGRRRASAYAAAA